MQGHDESVVGEIRSEECNDRCVERAAIIVAGGGAERLGGIDKPWLHVAGIPMIEHVVHAAAPYVDVTVVVAERRDDWALADQLMWTLESPRGGGPAAALTAGLAALPTGVSEVLVLAGDAPGVGDAIAALVDHEITTDGVAITSQERTQYLLARIHVSALVQALRLGGPSMRSVFDHLQIEGLPFDVLDADTWEDVARIRALSREVSMTERPWLDEVAEVLGISAEIDVDAILELTRDVAHNVERKNAPLTSYLLGYAAATQGLTPAEIAATAAKLGALACERGASNG